MQFNSYQFIVFLPIVVLGFYIIPKKARNIFLLVASYFFYMNWNPIYGILLFLVTAVCFVVGLAIDKYRDNPQKCKLALAIGCIIPIVLLAYFKYFGFLIDNINGVIKMFGGGEHIAAPDIVLPVGISFFTFQSIGYCIDIYRGTTECEKNPITFALFVSFFPQLVAGPIERSNNLLKQLRNTKSNVATYKNFAEGIITILYGLFLKMVLADRLAIIADNVFNSYYFFGSIELILGSIAFSLQIYCDFSSYSIIAMGVAKLMGFSLMENFKHPYFAQSVKEFWRLWHISLSTWLKDYVYIPLGGNRVGEKRRILNLITTFLVSGIWHGANWTYIVWGVLHGGIQTVEDFLSKKWGKRKRKEIKDLFSVRLGKRFRTFIIVDLLWIFFRAPSITDAFLFIKRMITQVNLWVLSDGSLFDLGLTRPEWTICIIGLIVLFVVDYIKYKTDKQFAEILMGERIWFRWLVIGFLVFAVLIWGKYGLAFDAKQFIYFQF